MSRPAYLYKYCSAKVAKIILETGRLRFSSPVVFNDPFDCYFPPRFANLRGCISEYEKRHGAIISGQEPLAAGSDAAFQFGPLVSLATQVPPEVLRRSLKNHRKNLRAVLELQNQEWEHAWSRQLSVFRVLCLCASGDNPLLWSHYADSHRGVALEFDTSAGVPFSNSDPVRYRKAPYIPFRRKQVIEDALSLRPLPGRDVFRPLLTTKCREWSYEQEWRNISHRTENENQLFEDRAFNARSLSRILLGCKITPRNKAAIRRLAVDAFAHAQVHEGFQREKTFGLEFVRLQ